MHEFSLAEEVIRIVEKEAEKHRLTGVAEIVIEVGDLSGVEADAFEFSLGILAKGTMIESSVIRLIRTGGRGFCKECDLEFEMGSLLYACPGCGFFVREIRAGREFRIVSIIPAE
jgi:hydrogenase nickel incorporation protein HypA/HybF